MDSIEFFFTGHPYAREADSVNRQPFQTPPKSWPHKMTPWLVRLWRLWRVWRALVNRTLRKSQKITQIKVQGAEHVRGAVQDGAGTLITHLVKCI